MNFEKKTQKTLISVYTARFRCYNKKTPN